MNRPPVQDSDHRFSLSLSLSDLTTSAAPSLFLPLRLSSPCAAVSGGSAD
ncbi:hypothetical protein Hanom_Chr16g01465531 [Helianthus anomalus]